MLYIEIQKNKNAQAAIDWLCKCIQEFDSAGEKWNLKARDMVENDNGRMDIELNKTMEFIGGVIEGVIKTYICFVNGCFSIQNGKVADPTIDLGVMTHNIIDKDAIFLPYIKICWKMRKYQIGEM